MKRRQRQSLKRILQAKLNCMRRFDEVCEKLTQQREDTKKNLEAVVDSLISTIEVKKNILLSELEKQITESLEALKARKASIEEEMTLAKLCTVSVGEADKLLNGLEQTDPEDGHLVTAVSFTANQRLLQIVAREGIGSLKMYNPRKASQALGLEEQQSVDEAQVNVLITRNAVSGQCCTSAIGNELNVEIRNKPAGQESCTATEVEINSRDQLIGMSCKISYSSSATDQGEYNVQTLKVRTGSHVQRK